VGFFITNNKATPYMIAIDVEIYKNYFLLSGKHLFTGKYKRFEFYDGHPPDLAGISKLMRHTTTVSFNGNNFDLILIAALLDGASVGALKKLCDRIIKGRSPGWVVAKNSGINTHRGWDHIDLFEVAPGRVSLKVYAARLGSPNLQDLPIEPNALLDADDRAVVLHYCDNCLDETERLYSELEPQVALRETMSAQYGMDLRSKSDAQIAETIITSELAALTGCQVKRPNTDCDLFQYQPPGIVAFSTPSLQAMFNRILATDFTLGSNGAVRIPDWLKQTKIVIGSTSYQMGIGGLHSCEKAQHLVAGDRVLCELDVASYYPNIILQQQLAPGSMGKPFLEVYQSIVDRRMRAKREGDTVTAHTLKIAVNGSFGKLGSKYSKLYAPELLIQTTITGQLCLLMLIERLEAQGVAIRSANTDGVVCHYPHALERAVDEVTFNWMLDTSFDLERTDYAALASRDVNNYIAVKPDGSMKGKGIFASTGIAKNPDRAIIPHAVAEYVSRGTPVADTIRNCADPLMFVAVRRVTGGAVWNGEKLGKAVRFYWANDATGPGGIRYVTTGNLVPKSTGGRPLMRLADFDRSSVEDGRYIAEANKLLREVGV